MWKSHFDAEFLVLLGPIISRLFTCSNAEKKLKKQRVLALVLSLCIGMSKILDFFIKFKTINFHWIKWTTDFLWQDNYLLNALIQGKDFKPSLIFVNKPRSSTVYLLYTSTLAYCCQWRRKQVYKHWLQIAIAQKHGCDVIDGHVTYVEKVADAGP